MAAAERSGTTTALEEFVGWFEPPVDSAEEKAPEAAAEAAKDETSASTEAKTE